MTSTLKPAEGHETDAVVTAGKTQKELCRCCITQSEPLNYNCNYMRVSFNSNPDVDYTVLALETQDLSSSPEQNVQSTSYGGYQSKVTAEAVQAEGDIR